MVNAHKIKLGLPVGNLKTATLEIFAKAGFDISVNERCYSGIIDDKELKILFFRAQEIPTYVERGILDAGITGKDWIIETEADVIEIAELSYSKQAYKPIKLVLAVAENSNIKSINDLNGKKISTEFVNITKNYLKKNKIKAEIEFSWGATELKVSTFADAIVELTESGLTLKENGLKILDVIMESTPRIIINKKSWLDDWKKEKMNNLAMLLKSVLIAQGKVGLKMNIKISDLKKIIYQIPALRKPTIAPLNERGWVAIEIIVDKTIARNFIPKLKKAGAEGIAEYPLNKIIL